MKTRNRTRKMMDQLRAPSSIVRVPKAKSTALRKNKSPNENESTPRRRVIRCRARNDNNPSLSIKNIQLSFLRRLLLFRYAKPKEELKVNEHSSNEFDSQRYIDHPDQLIIGHNNAGNSFEQRATENITTESAIMMTPMLESDTRSDVSSYCTSQEMDVGTSPGRDVENSNLLNEGSDFNSAVSGILGQKNEGKDGAPSNALDQTFWLMPEEDSISLEQRWGASRIQFFHDCIIPEHTTTGATILDQTKIDDTQTDHAMSLENSNHDDSKSSKSEYLTPIQSPSSSSSSLSTLSSNSPNVRPMSWAFSDGCNFKVRKGPNYPKNKQKAPSLPALYNTKHVKAFTSDRRTPDGSLAESIPMPMNELFENGQIPVLHDTRVPHVLLVHFQLPFESPNMLKKTSDGKGGEVILFLTPSKTFCEESNFLSQSMIIDEQHEKQTDLPQKEERDEQNDFRSGMNIKTKDKNNETHEEKNNEVSGATKLFSEWCENCESKSDEWQSRFKCMINIKDLDKLHIGFMKPYNGKPVLVGDTGRARRTVNKQGLRIIELTVNIHEWGYLCKRGFVSLIGRLKYMAIEVAFTIEARTDDEMPECILGSTWLDSLDPKKGANISSEFQKAPS
mmetsp:Transcript_8872/g.12640  ORF Transcript_8872/g.12640 Transcript_8872/m.12640 type:complete len:619 (+) Transcript_8872:40-1896(+)